MTLIETVDLFSAIASLYPRDKTFVFDSKAKLDLAAQLWHSLLSDLDKSIVLTALQRHALASIWPPTVAELRQIVTEIQHSETTIGADEAYGMLNRALHMHGFYEYEKTMAMLPPIVRDVVKDMGWNEVCNGDEPESVFRAHFMKMYEIRAARNKDRASMPQKLKDQIKQLGEAFTMPQIGGGS